MSKLSIRFSVYIALFLLTFPLHAQIITTVAGNGTFGYSGDGGPATSASMEYPYDIVEDKQGNLLILDAILSNVRKVSPNGIITTIIGGAGVGNGPLFYPSSIALDNSDHMFFGEMARHQVSTIDTNGVRTVLAGNGTQGFSGDGGPATAASLNLPWGVAIDRTGNLFISDQENHRIRKVDTNGIITTVAGTGVSALSGDGGPAISATLSFPKGLAFDRQGNLFVADQGNNRIRKINTNGIITTVSPELYDPFDVAVDSAGNLFIAERLHHVVRMIDTNGELKLVAGNGTRGFDGDGGYSERSVLDYPFGVGLDRRGNLHIAVLGSSRVRKVSGLIFSKQTGIWTNGTNWNCQCTPGINDSVTILSGHTVTVQESVQARTLKPFGRIVLTPNSKITFPSRGF
ncbi:NHL domain-containing protein [Spirosoma flavus]